MDINEPFFHAEPLHASLLGRNIYHYLTGSWPHVIDLDQPLFKTEIGNQYKQLIAALISEPAHSRMSLHVAANKLLELALYTGVDQQCLLNLSTVLDVAINPLIATIIRTDMNAGCEKQAIAVKIALKLERIKTSVVCCDDLMNKISALKIDGQHRLSLAMLRDARKKAMGQITSLDALGVRLDEFEQSLKDNLVKQKHAKHSLDQCNARLYDLHALKFDEQHLLSLDILYQARDSAVSGAGSPDNCSDRLDALTVKLNSMRMSLSGYVAAYQRSLHAMEG